MKIISFFNHKGGVGKTTSAYHIGWKLTQKGKRVLLIDTDSQCNLTLAVIGEDRYEDFVVAHPNDNIKSCLSSAFESRPELISPGKCVKVKGRNNLYLLPGSFEITEFEVQLGVSFQLSGSFSTMKHLPGSFYYLIKKTAEKYKIDIVVIDLNPSLSAINQDIIISSDYFIIPTAPDFFSQMAIQSLSRVIPTWERWAEQARELFQDSTYPLPLIKPKFLGFTINDYSIRNKKPAQAFKEIMDKIKLTVQNDLVPRFEKAGLLMERDKYEDNFCLAEISNFQSLQARYQKYGIPVFALSDEQLEAGGVVFDSQAEKRKYFNKIYSDCAKKILRMLEI